MPLDPEQWVDDYGDYLLRYAVSRLRNRDAAEDVLQETLLAALRAADQYAGTGSERGWLLGILKRKIVDHVRSRARVHAESEIEGSIDGDIEGALFHSGGRWKESPEIFGETAHAAVERGEFWNMLSDCLDNLPGKQQDVFVLRELEQLESDRICTLLELSTSNLGVLLHRARLRLATCLRVNWTSGE